jgi:hypothetical protein
MKIVMLSASAVFLALPLMSAPASAAVEPTTAGLVARYNFDVAAAGGVTDLSGRSTALTVRSAANGQITFPAEGTGRYASFPGLCAATAPTCPKALLEAPDDADLDPGTRNFRWAASVRLTASQLNGNANVMQKGVAGTESLWKMQITGKNGRAQCVMAARGNAQPFSAISARTVADGNWHRIVCERVGTALGISVDGVPGSKVTLPATATVDNAMPLRVGGPNLAKGGDMYHGHLDDVYAQLL